jgi:hypothetical protein
MSNSSEKLDAKCDESKCISYGLAHLFGYYLTCYANHCLFPMQCALGYTPHTVDTEPIIRDAFCWGTLGDFSYQYCTCCPPDLSFNVNISWHCSHSLSILNVFNSARETNIIDNSTLICEDENQPYPSKMAGNYGAQGNCVCVMTLRLNNSTRQSTT